jgi:crotonobetainyl-CoA:carnitine CoA-transferase CaiB-like acyl-CoA transferase
MTEQADTRARPRGTPALQGIRVLDMAWSGAGMFCAKLLGDLGAEVIMVHDPDCDRREGPAGQVLSDVPGLLGLRNCKTMGVDLRTDEGLEVFRKVVETVDVIIEGYGPGVAERLRVDYGTLAETNPRIVYAALSAYGADGPYRDVPGPDLNCVSVGGLLGMTGVAGGPPVMAGTLVAEFAAGGMGAVIGILGALMAREQTARGQFVDVSLTDGIVEMMSVWISPYLAWGALSTRGQAWLTGQWPWYNVYETKDGGYVSVGALEPWFYANLCRLLGSDDLIDHQYAEDTKRDEMFQRFREAFLTRTRDEWVDVLRQEDTCVAPVYSLEEVSSDPHLTARGTIQNSRHPLLGNIRQVGSMFKLSDSPFEVTEWSIRFGQHTDEILGDLGYDQARIDALRLAGAIQ